jgi:hypothetical protein
MQLMDQSFLSAGFASTRVCREASYFTNSSTASQLQSVCVAATNCWQRQQQHAHAAKVQFYVIKCCQP